MKAMDYFAALIAAAILIGGGYLIGIASMQPVAAASENNCVEIGTIGGAVIGKCLDPDTGIEFYFGPGQIKFVD